MIYQTMQMFYLGGRFGLTMMNIGTDKEVFKTSFVVQEHTDTEKHLLVHNSTTLRQSYVRLLVARAAFFGVPISGVRMYRRVTCRLQRNT